MIANIMLLTIGLCLVLMHWRIAVVDLSAIGGDAARDIVHEFIRISGKCAFIIWLTWKAIAGLWL